MRHLMTAQFTEAIENLFDSNVVTDILIAFTIIVSIVYYVNYSKGIEEEIKAVISNSLTDVNCDLSKQEPVRS